MKPKQRGQIFRDLADFARVEQESGDLEPWAALLKAISRSVNEETSRWLVSLYNSYDSMASAWKTYRRWPGPHEWAAAPDREDIRNYECTQERRNLRGGRIIKRFESYVEHLDGATQGFWLNLGMSSSLSMPSARAQDNFIKLYNHLLQVWGVGRQSAFEWVEFLGEVCGYDVKAPHAQLWESEGPRRSLQSLYNDPTPTPARLEEYANDAKDWLAKQGVDLPWEDFETVICDFHVMRKGRYYPGRHLAALRGEIAELEGNDRKKLLKLFKEIIPSPWNNIGPGIDKAMMPVYRDTGKIQLPNLTG